MKFTSLKQFYLLLLALVILSITIISCGSSEEEPIESIVAATLTAVAADEARIAAYVAETVAAMPTESENDEAVTEEVVETDVPNPTATPVPPATATAATDSLEPESSLPQIRMAAQSSAINVRKGPNVCFDVVAILNTDMSASIVGRDTQAIWYQIELTNGGNGWIWSENIEPLESDEIAQIPSVSSNLNCPTATPLPATAVPATVQATSPQKPSGSSNSTKVPTPQPPPATPIPCQYPYC